MLKNKAFTHFLLAFGLAITSGLIFYLALFTDIDWPNFLPWLGLIIGGISFVYGILSVLVGILQLIRKKDGMVFSIFAIIGGIVVILLLSGFIYLLSHLH
jgi:hypothetical protein